MGEKGNVGKSTNLVRQKRSGGEGFIYGRGEAICSGIAGASGVGDLGGLRVSSSLERGCGSGKGGGTGFVTLRAPSWDHQIKRQHTDKLGGG